MNCLHEVGKLILLFNNLFLRFFFVSFREETVEFVNGYNDKVDKPEDEGYKSMKCRKAQKADKVANIAVADTCAHPRTVMVVNLYAKATVSAVIRAWRSDYMARSAIRKHFLVVYLFYIELLLFWLNLKSPKTKEGFDWS